MQNKGSYSGLTLFFLKFKWNSSQTRYFYSFYLTGAPPIFPFMAGSFVDVVECQENF
jgi:hypothetical protein